VVRQVHDRPSADTGPQPGIPLGGCKVTHSKELTLPFDQTFLKTIPVMVKYGELYEEFAKDLVAVVLLSVFTLPPSSANRPRLQRPRVWNETSVVLTFTSMPMARA